MTTPRLPTVTAEPEGLAYEPDFEIEAAEDGREVPRHVARRTVVHFGYRYAYESWKLTAGSLTFRTLAAPGAGVACEDERHADLGP